MTIYPYCYNIRKGIEFYVGYFDADKKQNTLLKCVVVGEHNHIRFSDYGYGYGAYTEVKVDTPLGIRFIRLVYDMGQKVEEQFVMFPYPTFGGSAKDEDEVRVKLYASVEGYKKGIEWSLPTLWLDDFTIDKRGYEPYSGKLNLYGRHNSFKYYYIDADDGQIRKTSAVCRCYRLDVTAKKFVPVVLKKDKNGNPYYGVWTHLSKHTQRFASEHEATIASHKDVVIIGGDYTPTTTEKSAKDKLKDWVASQAISLAELKQIVDEM